MDTPGVCEQAIEEVIVQAETAMSLDDIEIRSWDEY